MGFGSGVLSCDIACSFDTYECPPAPTPSPTPSPSPTPTSTPSPSASSTQASPSPTPDLVESTPLTDVISQIESFLIPQTLRRFYTNSEGKITVNDIRKNIELWVDSWRDSPETLVNQQKTAASERCDINQDSVCNLRDLSVLFYFIEG